MGKVPVKPLGVFALLRLPAELFSARVLAMLKKEGLIDDTFIANLMKWRHTSGFSVHNSVRIAAKDETGITNLAQHIPDHNFQLVRYYGWYSNRMRGEHRKMKIISFIKEKQVIRR
jgi:hypothetical protein